MKHMILMAFAVATLMLYNGCALTSESVTEINQRIENRYNSFSTAEYRLTESLYENDVLTQKVERTELIKKPDKRKQVTKCETGSRLEDTLWICNGNTYSQISHYQILPTTILPTIANIYEYVNLPPGMTSYCGYFIDKGVERWEIPMEITDKSKYKVETSQVSYNGTNAIKAVVTVFMSEEAKQKQLAIGNTPRETIITYWFDSGKLTILKEESHSFGRIGEVGPVSVTGNSRQSTVRNEREIEVKTETIYEWFHFDVDIPDSEFEISPLDYPGVEFKRSIVDVQEKFK